MKRSTLTHQEAEIIGLQALTFIASDPAQFQRFAESTGVSAEDLKERAGTSEMLLACLGELLKNEPDLLMFCANSNIPPENIQLAEAVLDGSIRDAE